MEVYKKNTCEELYWETAKKAVEECKLALSGLLRLCRVFRSEERILENKYAHLFAPYGEGAVAEKLLDRMVALSIPAYQNDLSAIEDMLDNPYHSELNAHYYLETGRVIAEDYTLPVFDWKKYHALREQDGKKARELWEAHEEEKLRFFISIAEKLWDFSSFKHKYAEWLPLEEMEGYYEYCKRAFIENRVFLQLEWLLFACPQWSGKEEFLYQNMRVDFFLRAHRECVSMLPQSVFEGKIFKKRLSKKEK